MIDQRYSPDFDYNGLHRDDQSNVIVGGEVEVEGQVVTGAAAAEREQRPQITMSPQFTWQGLHQKSNYCFARGEAATEITLFVALIKGLPTPSRFDNFIGD